MSGGGGTTTNSTTPPPQVLAAYQNVQNLAGQAASQPLQQYSGPMVAGFTPDQVSGFTQTENSANAASPYINSAAQEFGQATTPLWSGVQQFSPSAVQQYESPYTQDVLNSTVAEENNQDAQQQQQVVSNAASSGAWGGDRASVAQGIVAGQQALANNQTNAGIENQGYSQALGEFNNQQASELGANEANSWLNSQAAFGLGSLGQEAESTGLAGASALEGTGAVQQSQAQSELNIPYEEFQQQQAYPFQTTQYLANIAEGIGSNSGGTGSTTTPGASTGSQVAGGLTTAAAIAALFLNRGGIVQKRDGGGGIIPDPSQSFIPNTTTTMGKGLPAPPAAAPIENAQADATSAASALGKLGNSGIGNSIFAYTHGGYGASNLMDPSGNAEMASTGMAVGPVKRGGIVGSKGHQDEAHGIVVPFKRRDDGGAINAPTELLDPNSQIDPAMAQGVIDHANANIGDVPMQATGTGGQNMEGFPGSPKMTPQQVQLLNDTGYMRLSDDASGAGVQAPASLGPSGSPGTQGILAGGGGRYADSDMATPHPLDFDTQGEVGDTVKNGPVAAPPVNGITTSFMPSKQAAEDTGKDAWKVGLLSAGLGMLAGKSPNGWANIGTGGEQGLQTYESLKKTSAEQMQKAEQSEATQGYQNATIQQHADEFGKTMELSKDKLKQAGQQNTAANAIKQSEIDATNAYRNAEIGTRQAMLDQGKFGAMQPGMGTDENGNPVAGAYVLNSKTGETTFKPGVNLTQKPPAAGSLLDPGALNGIVQRYVNGDKSVLTGLSRSPAMVAQVQNAIGDYVAKNGGNPNAVSQAQQTFGAKTKAIQAFDTGTQGNAVRSLNVAVQHLDTLGGLSDALGNGDVQKINQLGNYISQQTGNPAPTNFAAARDIVGDEVVKAVMGSGTAGALGDREAIKTNINAASSPQQLKQVIATYQNLMAGQLNGLRQQYEQGTGLHDFNTKLAPETWTKLYNAGQPAHIQPGQDANSIYQSVPPGGKYYDPQGNLRTKAGG